MNALGEYWKDVLLLVGVLGPLVLAVIAILIAGWQIIQAHQHGEKIQKLNILCMGLQKEFEFIKADTELNHVYSDLMRSLAINLMSTDAIQESRIRILEGGGARSLDRVILARKIDDLNSQYMKLVQEISLMSRSEEVRRQSILALGAGAGDMDTYDLLHHLARRFPDSDCEEVGTYWAAIGMIRERYLRQERLGRVAT